VIDRATASRASEDIVVPPVLLFMVTSKVIKLIITSIARRPSSIHNRERFKILVFSWLKMFHNMLNSP
jgi:hypothetical protein